MQKIDELGKNLKDLQKQRDNIEGKYSYIQTETETLKEEIKNINQKTIDYKKAVELIGMVQQFTVKKTKKGFEKIVTYALKYIFNDDYKFKLEFKKRGNLKELNFNVITPECKEALDPLDSSGGGILDILSLALRISLLQLKLNKDEYFVVLDEPFKHLSKDYLENAGKFIESISEKINKQIIMITHKSDFLQIADKSIKIGGDNNADIQKNS